MKIASITKELIYQESKPNISIMMETETSKEIRITFKKGQIMKEHKAPFPIVVQVFRGAIDFGVSGEKVQLNEGDLISLKGNVLHDLAATEDSIVRLSLSKNDMVERVQKIETA